MSTRLLAPILLMGSVALVYAPVAGHDYVAYDDHQHVLRNPMLDAPLSGESIARAFRPYHNNWIPLTYLSLQVDRALWGEGAGPILLTNAALHTLAAWLLFVAVSRATAAPGRSFFVAAVFALHPLHVESVAWVSERKDALSALCFALCLLAWLRYAERPGAARMATVVAAFALGLMAKPMVLTLPFVLLLLDAWPLERLRAPRDLGPRILEKWPLFVLTVLSASITWWVQSGSGATWATPPALALRLQNAIDAIAWYAAKTAWPTGLAIFYPYPAAIEPARTLAGLALLLALTLTAALAWRRARRYVAVGWLWFLGMLVPVLGLVQVGMQARADRYAYLPQIGLVIAATWTAADLVPARARRALPALAASVLLVLAIRSAEQVGVWRDTRTLFEHALSVTPSNYEAERALARLAWLDGDFDEAERRYANALRANPGWAETHLDLANLLRLAGRPLAAAPHYARAAELDGRDAHAASALGSLLLELGRPEPAGVALAEALRRAPDDIAARSNLAVARLLTGDRDAAADAAREALRLDPSAASAATTLMAATRDPLEAVAAGERALLGAEGAPDPRLLGGLAGAYAAAGSLDEAALTAARAVPLAEAEGDAELAAQLRARAEEYRRRALPR